MKIVQKCKTEETKPAIKDLPRGSVFKVTGGNLYMKMHDPCNHMPKFKSYVCLHSNALCALDITEKESRYTLYPNATLVLEPS